jgi:adenine-specific DNA-methyltransferase
MIYIDPPYNTGKDFLYKDNFTQKSAEWKQQSGDYDEEGNRLVLNTESNGRFHSDWLSMMYPRLKLARNLLRDDGVIFISIDDNEVSNLKKLCDEIFGEDNFLVQCVWRKTDNQANIGNIARVKEYIISYARNIQLLSFNKMQLTDRAKKEYRYSDETGKFRRSILLDKTRGSHFFKVKTPGGKILNGPWMKKENDFWKMEKEEKIYWTPGGNEQPYGKIYLHESKGQIANDFLGIEYGTNQQASLEVEGLFGSRYFDFPKPTSLIKHFIILGTVKNDTILDFFSGSATTAHAVMQLNAEDGGKRKFIMVQLPEKCDKESEAFKAGYKTIADIGKERICRAGEKIKQENPKIAKELDIGFRVLKLDSSNMLDIYYTPNKLTKGVLFKTTDNIKPERSNEDLLFHVLLDWGIDLTYPIKKQTIAGIEVFFVAENSLVACFAKAGEIDDDFCKQLATKQPLQVVFCDTGFADDDVKINATQIFKQLELNTEIRTI